MSPECERSRPLPGTGPATNLNASSIVADRPIDTILPRLERVRKAPRGWVARCPAHEDRFPSLSVAEGDDHRVLLHDHAGCTVEEITRALHLKLSDLFPRKDNWRPEPRPRGRQAKLSRNVTSGLLWRRQFPLEWEISKLLAPLPPTLAMRDVLAGWDFLKRLDVDIPFLWDTVQIIRAAALSGGTHSDHGDEARAVRAFLRRINRETAERGA